MFRKFSEIKVGEEILPVENGSIQSETDSSGHISISGSFRLSSPRDIKPFEISCGDEIYKCKIKNTKGVIYEFRCTIEKKN